MSLKRTKFKRLFAFVFPLLTAAFFVSGCDQKSENASPEVQIQQSEVQARVRQMIDDLDRMEQSQLFPEIENSPESATGAM